MHFTLKQNPLRYEHLQDFIAAYSPGDRSPARSLSGSAGSATTSSSRGTRRPRHHLAQGRLARGHRAPAAPEVIAQEIIEDLEAALTEFAAVARALVTEDREVAREASSRGPAGRSEPDARTPTRGKAVRSDTEQQEARQELRASLLANQSELDAFPTVEHLAVEAYETPNSRAERLVWHLTEIRRVLALSSGSGKFSSASAWSTKIVHEFTRVGATDPVLGVLPNGFEMLE